ncbi:MAG: BCCT family transporter, partial [bacterium]|nr:BCCT family transporter [bacterium]
CLAYFGFRKGYPLLASTPIKVAFTGKFGDYLGGVADVVAILSVVFGVAGSLGLGVMQISSGLNMVFDTPDQTIGMWLMILACLTIAYMISASTSLDKGIKILSNLNMIIAVVLLLFILFVGPTGFILSTFITSVGDYLFQLVPLSFRLNPYSGETAWTCSWTLTYLIWWIAWAPFVGIFVARISRGRTIRQFVTAVILVPSAFTALWFATLGGTGLHIELFGGGGLGTLVLEDVSKALFGMFQFFPLTNLLCVIAIVLQFVFLVTSADSASFVLGMMTTKGSLNPSAPRKLFWGIIIALLTATTIFAGGGVKLMKAIAISGAIPFIVIMIIHIACLLFVIGNEKIPAAHAARTRATGEKGEES